MTSKAVLKLAEDLLDRAFREAEGQADRKVDLVQLVEEARSTLEKAEPALEYLHSRGLIHPPTAEGLYLTPRGVDAMAKETDIKALPKYEKSWGGGGASAQSATPIPVVTATPAHPRPYRPMLSFIDPNGALQTFDLTWSATVGRSDEATLTLPDPRASKRHVEVKYAGDKYIVRDLGSANGTMVNGAYVELHPLEHGDVLLIGRTEVTYTCPEVMPEPLGEPPPDMASARPRPPVAGEPTARPERASPEPARPVMEAPRAPVEVARAPAIESVRTPAKPQVAPQASPQPEIIRGTRTPQPMPPRPLTPQTAPSSAATPAASAARRRTAGTPLSSAEVPIVKGRPEAPPSAAVVDPSGLFDAAPAAPPADLFGDAPTVNPGPRAAAAATPAPDLFEADTPAVMSAPVTAPPRRGDLFEAPPVSASSPGAAAPGPDLFAGGSGGWPAGQAPPDLFAQAGGTRPAAPDLFAPRHDQRPSDLFAPDYSGGAGAPPPAAPSRTAAPDLFAEQPTVDQPVGDTYVRGTGSISPLPSTSTARAPEDLLPLDVEIEEPVLQLDEPVAMDASDVLPLDEPVEAPAAAATEAPPQPIVPLESVVDDSDGATIAGMNPLLAAREAVEAARAAVISGRTSELPAWGRGEDASLAPFASPDPGQEEPLMVGPPDDGGFDERTPVEEGPAPAAPEQILAAAADLPEAPSLDDVSGDVMSPVAWARFSETLTILRSRLADAGVPDQARLEEAIELLRKHPSVRAALTDP